MAVDLLGQMKPRVQKNYSSTVGLEYREGGSLHSARVIIKYVPETSSATGGPWCPK